MPEITVSDQHDNITENGQRQHDWALRGDDVAVVTDDDNVVTSGEAVMPDSSLPTARPSVLNRLLTNVGLAVGSVFAALLCLEGMLRVVGYDPFGYLVDGRQLIVRESPNPEMIYELTPGSAGFAWGTNVKINSAGFRDREYDVHKPETVSRIVAIGDSITFGNYLPLAATFPKQLERRLREHGVQAEVLNFGVGGYNILQELAFLESRGLQFEPDAVIVGYCMNDLGEASLNLNYIRRAARYGSPLYKSRLLQFVRSRLDIVEAKLDALARARAQSQQEGSTGDPYVDERTRLIAQHIAAGGPHHHLTGYLSSKNLDKLKRAFGTLRELSLEHGFVVSVVVIPFLQEPYAAYEAAYELVEYEAIRNGLAVVKVRNQFREVGIQQLMLRASDVIHPNEQGHQIIAEALLETSLPAMRY